MFKRIFCLFLALVLTAGIFPVTAYAEEDGSSTEETVIVETEAPETEPPVIETTEALVVETEPVVIETTQPPVVETVPVVIETTEPPVVETTEATVPDETQAPVVETTVPVETEAPVVETTAATEAIESEELVKEGFENMEGELYHHVDIDNEAIFSEYVSLAFSTGDSDFYHRPTYNGTAGRTHLSSMQRKVYDKILSYSAKMAKGTASSGVLKLGTAMGDFTPNIPVTFSGLSGADFWEILDALVIDHPYEMYWYRGSAYIRNSYYLSNSGYQYVELCLSIAAPFNNGKATTSANGYTYYLTANTTKTKATTSAVSKAKAVVKNAEGKTDYGKIKYYADWISNKVVYDDDAVMRDPSLNLSPWTLINVFDGNAQTNVVCEGYSEAFQYLCDLSTFADGTVSYICFGDWRETSSQSSYGGLHEWNVVKLGGKYYVVDVTHYDGSGKSMNCFLSGGTYSKRYLPDGYSTYCRAYKTSNGYYAFDEDNMRLNFGKTDLKFNTAHYKPVSSIAIRKAANSQDVTGMTLKRIPGKSFTLQAVCSPSTASTKSVRWVSSNTSVATVDANGVVKTKAAGTTTITAVSKDGYHKTGKVIIKVYPAATSVSIKKGSTTVSSKTLSMLSSKTLTLSASCAPSSAMQSVTWTSSNTSIATVSSKGVVTAKKAGTVTITAKAKDGSGKSAKVTIKVTK